MTIGLAISMDSSTSASNWLIENLQLCFPNYCHYLSVSWTGAECFNDISPLIVIPFFIHLHLQQCGIAAKFTNGSLEVTRDSDLERLSKWDTREEQTGV